MSARTIFIIQGFDTKSEQGQLENVVVFEVFAKSEKEALEKAKKYVLKNDYRVAQIIEK